MRLICSLLQSKQIDAQRAHLKNESRASGKPSTCFSLCSFVQTAATVTSATINLESADVFVSGDIENFGNIITFIPGTSTLIFDGNSGTQTIEE